MDHQCCKENSVFRLERESSILSTYSIYHVTRIQMCSMRSRLSSLPHGCVNFWWSMAVVWLINWLVCHETGCSTVKIHFEISCEMLDVRCGGKFFESSKSSWSSKSKWSLCWQAGEDGLSYLLSFPYIDVRVGRKEKKWLKGYSSASGQW